MVRQDREVRCGSWIQLRQDQRKNFLTMNNGTNNIAHIGTIAYRGN